MPTLLYVTILIIIEMETREKEVWTVLGRKKILLVDEDNQVVKEIKDLGPLSEIEMKYVNSNCGMPFDDWLETLKDEDEENDSAKDCHSDEAPLPEEE
jgi:hypothetical protein